ncbi:MFS transporter [Sandaracinus amylolyticus]|uniref:Major facilitator superfamily (MFS) transport protein n=1 Tax=Sandaracinus amylolyticus TaxID=927083 RepID=A0A0F6SHA9_9BACT|nr:MFS transporter [Sandaracinus amylolyticus]AKF10124.1 Major facilitator superfamily (MFS) transport protein [Sandaracinus amylolyticus]
MSAPITVPGTLDDQTMSRSAKLAVVVAALGYLVDIYDLILFGVVRRPSLQAIGVTEDQLANVGHLLLDVQMAGMLLGGVVWGVIGDKRGRLSVLFGSILMYSVANIANGFVTDVTTYAILRFVAGIGLAGELGAGVTLVTELLPAKTRGWATTLIAGIGICGALLAVGVSKIATWYVAYWIGGVLGLALLALRVGVFESGMFARIKAKSDVSRGNFLALFTSRDRARRYVGIVLVGVPIWYAIAILVMFGDSIGRAMGMERLPDPAWGLFWCYLGLALGDFASGFASQVMRSRKRALLAFCGLNVVALAYYFTFGSRSTDAFYVGCFVLGIANGYWAVFVTVAAEQFGTNLRATAATTAPNFVRGSVVPVSFVYLGLRDALGGEGVGEATAALIVGVVVIVVSMMSLRAIEETYGKELDFVER